MLLIKLLIWEFSSGRWYRWNPRRSWRVTSTLQCSQVSALKSLLQSLCGIRCGDKIDCLFIASANFSSMAQKRSRKTEKSPNERKQNHLFMFRLCCDVEANLYLFSCFYLAKLDSLSLYSSTARYFVARLIFPLFLCACCNDEAEFVDFVFCAAFSGRFSYLRHRIRNLYQLNFKLMKARRKSFFRIIISESSQPPTAFFTANLQLRHAFVIFSSPTRDNLDEEIT